MTIVTAAVIIDNNKVLIAQRQTGCNYELKWEFPGGKLEKGETPEECIIREIKEELAMEVRPLELYNVINFDYKGRKMKMFVFISRLIGGSGAAIECNDFKWVSKQELDMYDFTPADLPIVDKLKKGNLIN
ncbi:MAG: 8-oxo-dGTP diphosphatase MutT [Bacillota bacterium]